MMISGRPYVTSNRSSIFGTLLDLSLRSESLSHGKYILSIGKLSAKLATITMLCMNNKCEARM